MNNKKQRILVVDDEERIVRMIRLNLEHDGFTVIEANNGMQAINQVREKLPNPRGCGCSSFSMLLAPRLPRWPVLVASWPAFCTNRVDWPVRPSRTGP